MISAHNPPPHRSLLRDLWLLVLLAAWVLPATAADGWSFDEPEILPVEEAFLLTAEAAPDGGALLARWTMPDGYYLYRHRFAFETRPAAGDDTADVVLGEAEIPPGKRKVDEYFGEVEVYYHDASARVPVQAGSGLVEVGISYQGCADAGLCYPPQTRWVPVQLAALDGVAEDTGTAPAVQRAPPSNREPAAPGDGAVGAPAVPQTEEQQLASLLGSGSLWQVLPWFLLLGVGLAFTPCVLPMVPILSSIIVGESEGLTRRRAFTLSLAYVLGMAMTYAALGVLVGLFGASLNLQAALQSPLVLTFFAGVFVALALSMFGFYELQLPQAWQNGLNDLGQRVGGGKLASVWIMGALSSLVVSPCVSAPLAGSLIYISTTGDALLGGAALLALGLGMGVPLLLIGASGGHLLPRAGAWMNAVKAVFGVLLLAVAIWLLERVLPAPLTLALWATLAIASGVYLGALDMSPRQGWGQLWKAGGVFSLAYGLLLLIGAASGADDPLKPLARLTGPAAGAVAGSVGGPGAPQPSWARVDGLAQLQAALASARRQGRPAVVDLYADWCISCKVMERSVFPEPEVAGKLARFALVKLDVTDNDADDQALLQQYGLYGPPAMLFFAPDGSEMSEYRIRSEVGTDALAAHLRAALAQVEAPSATELAANFAD